MRSVAAPSMRSISQIVSRFVSEWSPNKVESNPDNNQLTRAGYFRRDISTRGPTDPSLIPDTVLLGVLVNSQSIADQKSAEF